MARTDLLSAVLSDEGWYCVVGLKKTGMPKQVFVQSLEEVETEIDDLLAKHYDVYFACSKYEVNSTRTTDNVKNIKAFWLDIDCGKDKPYETQGDGVRALKHFCADLGLPRPTLVNSGRGVHVYWPLKEAITRPQWKTVADRLKVICHERGLHADPARTADAASILRIPGTLNTKGDPPLDVVLMCDGVETSYEEFKEIVGALEEVPEYARTQINELTKSLMGNKQSRFSTIMMKVERDGACPQLASAVADQESLEEPRWRAALSIAAHCVDMDEAIHDISSKHPDYSPAVTAEKAARIKGPYTCDAFDKIHQGVCGNCPNKGKITSPIVLGQEIVAADPEDNVIQFTASDVSKPVTYTVPEYPYPYFRGRTGGVYKKADDEDEDEAVLIYEHDLYVVKRMKDPQHGEVVWMRLHTPKDGVREFALPAVDLLTTEKLREKLAWFGVIAMKKQMEAIMAYIVRFTKELQCREGADIMRTQFGWTDGNRSFVVGDTEICADGDRYSPPSSYTAPLADYFIPVGSLEEWKTVISVYDMPGLEPMAFGFFTAFGAPLLKHLNLKGALINMINNQSGTGKTTAIKAMHSVYGHPEEVMLIQRDTMNVKLHRLGVMNNLPLGCDELTKMTPDEFSDLSYAASQGRGRARMQSSVNAERSNFARWETIVLCSSNASAVDKLKSLKATADGELMRVIEYSIPETKVLTKEEADEIFPKLYSNYGHAGRIYIRDLVCNLEERIKEVKDIQLLIDRKIGFTNRERFWSGVAACNIAGAMFARRLGLIDIDVGRVFKWLVKEFTQMRQEIKPPASSYASVIGEYWNEQRQNTLVINDEIDKRTGVELLPILEPRGELTVRMEPDTQKLFLVSKKFREYCSKNQITLKDVLNALAAEGVYVGTVKKRMSKGTKLSSTPPVDTYVFDCARGDFLDPDTYISAANAEPDSDQDSPAIATGTDGS